MKQKKRHPFRSNHAIGIFIGILSLAYPFVSDTLNDYLDQQNHQKLSEKKQNLNMRQ